jgi:hypothetical protein
MSVHVELLAHETSFVALFFLYFLQYSTYQTVATVVCFDRKGRDLKWVGGCVMRQPASYIFFVGSVQSAE